jgi:precorrin-6B methylase 2
LIKLFFLKEKFGYKEDYAMSPLYLILIGVVVVLFIAYSIAHRLWRKKSSPTPCPWFLRFLLENPLMNYLAGASVLIDRINLEPGMHLIDVGCGPGRLTIPFAKHVGHTGHIFALDIQKKMLQTLNKRIIKNRLENVEAVLGGAGEGVIQRENAFDRAVLVTVLGEIPDRRKALEEIFKTLKPSGILSVTEVKLDPDYQKAETVLRLARDVGFEYDAKYSNVLSFTMNFRKPGVQQVPQAGCG